MSFRFVCGASTVFDAHVLEPKASPPPSIYKFAVTTFSDQHLRHDFIIQLVIRYVDVQISRSTPGSRSLHITVLRHTL